MDADLDPCPYHILTSMGGSKKTWRLTKQEIVIQVNPNKLVDYTIMRAWIMVTHVMSNVVLVRGVVLYPLGVTIDFWKEIAYHHPSWQTGASHKALLTMRFIWGQLGKSKKSTMLVRFSSLPHGFELLEGNVHD
jgi:hypothetical protein